MKIAMLGTRGIPASYGGFETCVEQIAVRLASKGHDVTVYCRADYPRKMERQYKGVHLVHLPRLRKSFVESPFNSFIATMHASLSGHDILHYFGCGNVPFLLIPRMMRKGVILTVDGLEWNRMSYSKAARVYLRSFAELATVFPDIIVADSPSSEKWYFERTGIRPKYQPYGIEVSQGFDESVLAKYGLEKGRYVLFVGRLVYEKGVHTLVEAFRSVPGDTKLVIIGDSPTPNQYVNDLKENADKRTVFLGYVFGEDYESIKNGAMIYVHPSLLDGTSISLLSALASGKCVLSSDLKENMEVAGDSAIYFQLENPADLSLRLKELVEDPSKIEDHERLARKMTESLQDWDSVTDTYEAFYESIIEGKGRQ